MRRYTFNVYTESNVLTFQHIDKSLTMLRNLINDTLVSIGDIFDGKFSFGRFVNYTIFRKPTNEQN